MKLGFNLFLILLIGLYRILFKYSLNNQNSISFSQKKFNDGEKFIVKIQKINSISKAIQVLSEVKD